MAAAASSTVGAGFAKKCRIPRRARRSATPIVRIAGPYRPEGTPAAVGCAAAMDGLCDRPAIDAILSEVRPDAILHLAAESHVDRSIDGAAPFIETNVGGTFVLLDVALAYWRELDETARARFRRIRG